MIGWFRRLVGLDCCGPWTKWDRVEVKGTRAPKGNMELLAFDGRPVPFTRVVQERKCQGCGRVQVERLNY